MQISITAGNSRKRDAKEAMGKYQESRNNQRVTRHRLGRAQAQIRQKHGDMTGEHKCMVTGRMGQLIILIVNKTGRMMKNNKCTKEKTRHQVIT